MITAFNVRFNLLLSTAVAATLAMPSTALAQNLPVGPSYPGTTTVGNTMTVDLINPRTVINWESFDIAPNYTVDFKGAPPVEAVLNRVVGASPNPPTQSDIYGNLKSDPWIEVFLINPAGIIFGSGARVNVGSLIASTLDTDDEDFLAGGALDPAEPLNPTLYYSFGGSLVVEDSGITVQNGAQVNTSTGPLTLLGAFIDVQAGGSVTGATDVGLIAGNFIRVPADPGSRVDYFIRKSTPKENAITIAGQVSGENVIAFMETAATATNALLYIAESGSITATEAGGGAIILGIGARTAGGVITNSPGGIRNDGTLDATGDVILSGEVAGATGTLFAPRFVENNGTITAGDDVIMRAQQDITNSGTVAAVGDVILGAGRDILDLSESLEGSIAGRDVALSAGGSITVGTVTARDDIAIRANGTVTSGSLTSGATIGNNGPVNVSGAADALLEGVDLSGHDIDVDGSAIAAGVIRALGTGSDIRLRAPVTASRDDLDFAAGGDITIEGSASGVDVAMDAGGTITTGNISARDDIALRAGNTLNVGTLTSGATIGTGAPVDQAGSADALLGEALAGHDLFVEGGSVSLTQATANGPNSDLTVRATTGDLSIVNGTAGGTITLIKEGTTGILTAGTLLAGTGATLTSDTDIDAQTVQTITGDLAFTAAGDVTVHSSLAADDVAIDAGGTISTGDISARDDIALRAGDTLDVGTLSSGVSIGGTGPVDSTGAADALLSQDLEGHDLFVQGGSVSLTQASATGTNSDLNVTATTGDLSIANGTAGGTITLIKQGTTGILTAGTLLAGTGAALTSDTDIDAQTVQTTSGDIAFTAGRDVTVHSSLAADDVAIDAGRNITAGDISARDDIALRAGDTLNIGTLSSGVTIGGTGPVDSAGAADALLSEDLAGHDLFVEGGSVSLTQATANGTNSDLTVRATTGDLSIVNGTAGGTITLIKQGTTGILTAGTLLAGTGATLTSETDILAQTVQTVSGDLAFTAGRDVVVDSPLTATDVAIKAGRNITTGNITARDDIAIVAGASLQVGTLTSGVAAGGSGPVDSAGAADALLAQNLAGHDISVQAASVSLAMATANGTNSDLVVRATTGDLSIANGTAGGVIRLTKEGGSGALSAGTLSAGTGASLTSSTSITADNVQSASGDIAFDAMAGVTIGTVLAQAGNVDILADDLDILGSLGGSEVTITNRSGGANLLTVLGDPLASGAFTLTQDELNSITAGIVNIDSLDQNLLIGNVAFDADVGSTRLNLLGTGRVDIVGEINAAGAARTLQIGGTTGAADPNDPSTLASIIRIAATSEGGGRIILDGTSLDLRGAKIGVGLDDGFLEALGLTAGGTPVSAQVVEADWVGNPNSSLYGIPGGYADPTVISAGNVTVTYTDYALFQNTGTRTVPSGVTTGGLTIVSSGDQGNGFELFGTIDEVRGRGAALLVQPQTVSLSNSRVNGCLIVSGGGCATGGGETELRPDMIESMTNPTEDSLLIGAADNFAQQELVSTDDADAFNFDSLVGTNNEGLLGVLGIEDADAPKRCTPNDKNDACPIDGPSK